MSETTTAVVIAAAAVGLYLVYTQQQQQQQVTNALLFKIATPTPAPAANPLQALASIAGPLIGLL